ncbi:E3 SUMO-protein ligase ZBED1-like [Haliotis rufescens]|uniref:E3 SUMO-protein ligase ZBED1-like n=1 Tax=Haliotis rufescens TaxID=6454 RepID=UPI00201F5F91|nr:E3 SUMO-protein ligase ZBED1-like [Haliotis rufescens]
MRRHHPLMLSTSVDRSHKTVTAYKTTVPSSPTFMLASSQPTISHVFTSSKMYPNNSHQAQLLNEKVARFIIKGLRPYSVVDSPEFRDLIQCLDPRYKLPSRTTFAERIIPDMYKDAKQRVAEKLSEAEQVALTTDGWTSCATDSYLTITSCHLSVNWEIINFVLQTRVLNESHTAENISEVLNDAVKEWKLPTTFGYPPVTTDNAANVTKAIALCESVLHVPCLAHTINLAVQKSLKVKRVSHVLAKIRRIVAFFHRSPKASAMLKDKALLLSLPGHDLIIDVVTRWNSAYDMMTRFLEMQCAVLTVLMDKVVSKCKGDLATLSDEETRLTEDVIQFLKPMKDMTTMLCTENSPTVSIIMPLKHHLMNVALTPKDDDSPTVAEMKRIMASDIEPRYVKQAEMLCVASAVDPRFKHLPFLSAEEKYDVFGNITAQTAKITEKNKPVIKTEPDTNQDPPLPHLPEGPLKTEFENTSAPTYDSHRQEPSQSPCDSPIDCTNSTKPSTLLEGLLGDVFIVKSEPAKSAFELAKLDVDRYCCEPGIALGDSSLSWWKTKEDKYPRLAQLAKMMLCIPATSVPSERAFSTAGDIVSHQRASMKPENVDILLFLKKNLK